MHERSLVEKNAVALQEQKIKPMSLLGRLQREQKPIPLPDGSVLEPPPFARPGVRLSDWRLPRYVASGAY